MNAIDQKDQLREIVFQPGEVLERCERWHCVLSALNLTVGLWSELRYAYKGRELCEWILDEANAEQRDEDGKCRHHATHRKIAEALNAVKTEAWRVQMIFHAEQEAANAA